MAIRKENRVIIRIWTSDRNEAVPGEDVGHISLEFGDTYTSLWPQAGWQQRKTKVSQGLFQPVLPDYKIDYEADCYAEGRIADGTLCLYSLDIEAMQQAFETAQQETEGWALCGNNFILNQNSAHSCASLAYTLLKAGNIYDLVPGSLSSTLSVVPSPDMLLHMIIEAKKTEFTKYPETVLFTYEGESTLPDENPKSGLKCSLL